MPPERVLRHGKKSTLHFRFAGRSPLRGFRPATIQAGVISLRACQKLMRPENCASLRLAIELVVTCPKLEFPTAVLATPNSV